MVQDAVVAGGEERLHGGRAEQQPFEGDDDVGVAVGGAPEFGDEGASGAVGARGERRRGAGASGEGVSWVERGVWLG